MKRYRAKAKFTITSGNVRVSGRVLERTHYALGEASPDGDRKVLGPIQFRQGDEFAWDGEVDKGSEAALDEIDEGGNVVKGDEAVE